MIILCREIINITEDKACIILKGAGSDNTIIQYNNPDVGDKWNPTFFSSPPNVIVLDITIKNTYGVGSPAIAAAIFGDKSVFYNCKFYSFQDTLLDSKGRHYFKNCYIQGGIDFIFGNGQSYYEDCVINATGPVSPAFVTAQRRNSENDPSGFIFSIGSVIGNSVNVKLGRAYSPYSRVLFFETHFSSAVVPSERWNAWHYKGHESKFTYAAVKCTGPGTLTSHNDPLEKKIDDSKLEQFSLSFFINNDGWLSNLPIRIL
ncbi:hypothetical protein Lal_00028948 [Lupinus albus]|uniref:pectinesterase n=1 Tax=Lupinus albus TaxID=3870 RepID=A0A6A4NUJ2_LUPAL|nr:putative pectinesterase [Lupinus albus]KAF1885059.1 hypothetical protein Lal_00028948 [Lupinus albus]